MTTAIKMPDLGTAVDYVRLVGWLKKEGEHVKRGEPLCEVETDKAASELESVAEGILLKQLVPADTEIDQGTIIAYVGKTGEVVPDLPVNVPAKQQPETEAKAVPMPVNDAKVPTIIRNLARSLGVDVSKITGTGTGGRITREDLTAVKEFGGLKNENMLSRHQSAVARRVSASQREIPPIHIVARIEMSRVIAARQENAKAPFDVFFIFALSRIVKDFPNFLSKLNGENVVQSAAVNIACAMDLGSELFTPVIKDADKKTLGEIAREFQLLADKAGKEALTPDDMKDACMTISNLGMYPVEFFTMVIPPGQSAGLAVGAINRNAPEPFCRVTLSVDHRLINGREAARFVKQLKEFLETL